MVQLTPGLEILLHLGSRVTWVEEQGVHKVWDEVLVCYQQRLVLEEQQWTRQHCCQLLVVAHASDTSSITYSVAHAEVSGKDVVGTGLLMLFPPNSTNILRPIISQ